MRHESGSWLEAGRRHLTHRRGATKEVTNLLEREPELTHCRFEDSANGGVDARSPFVARGSLDEVTEVMSWSSAHRQSR
jgi:hypothetical protein